MIPTPALAARISAEFENVVYTVVPCDKGAAAIGLQVRIKSPPFIIDS